MMSKLDLGRLKFSWDDRKSELTYRRRGFDFMAAASAFLDPHQLPAFNSEKGGEERWQVLAGVRGLGLLCVVYTTVEHEDYEEIRIISARKATGEEANWYRDPWR